MSIQKIRAGIDALDEQIVALLNQRAKLAQAAGQAKAGGLPFRPAREAEVIRHVLSVNSGPLPGQALTTAYREIIAACLALERPLRVGYLGPAGTYSEEAAHRRFGSSPNFLPYPTLDTTIDAAQKGLADVVVLPVENSTEGAVNRTLDLLLQTPLKVIGEILLPIHHQLLSKARSLKAITTVAGHPQALGQCREWLESHLPQAKQVAADSNAHAAQAAAKHQGWAAVAGEAAGRTYKLPVLAANIEDDSANTTLFAVLGDLPVPPTGHDKTSLICSVPNRAGSLAKLITVLADAGVNMTKLASRPSPTGLWDYTFYIDIDGHADDPPVAKALKQLEKQALFVKVLGSYPKGGQ